MAVTLVLNFKEGLLPQAGEEMNNDIVHYIDLTADNINQEPTTQRISQILPVVTPIPRRQSNVSDEIIVEAQKICRRRLGNRMRSQARRRSRETSRERSRSNTRERSRGRSRGHSRGHSRSRSRGNSRGRSRDRTQGRAKGHSKKKFRHHCRCQKDYHLTRNSTLEDNRCYSGRYEKCNSI